MRDGTEGLLVTVADIIALPAFKNVELAAPCEGAERREVRNVGILDLAPDEQAYADYLPGEFIASNLGFARDDAALANVPLTENPDILATLAAGKRPDQYVVASPPRPTTCS